MRAEFSILTKTFAVVTRLNITPRSAALFRRKTMDGSRTLWVVGWLLGALMVVPAAAQGSPQVVAVAKPPLWRQKTLNFSGGKALLGLPDGVVAPPHCSPEGTTFLDFYKETKTDGAPELYSVSPSGEVKHLLRTLPKDFTSISIRDFFAAEHTLVTLIKVEKRDDPNSEDSRVETRYFLSVSDLDGDGGKLLELDLKFRPLKIAMLQSEEFIVLGWDDNNLVPVLALLKEDGTLRRFMDLDNRKYDGARELHEAYTSLKEAASAPATKAVLRSLESAKFVPNGDQVLLTQPGSALAVVVLSALGEESSVPLHLPAGFLLHDLLVSDAHSSWVVRAQAAEDFKKFATDHVVENPRQRVFEVSSVNGSLIREFLFDKPHPMALTCAAHYKLSAIFDEPIPDASRTDADAGDKAAKAAGPTTQLVISTISR
jgi:hypothetical protein